MTDSQQSDPARCLSVDTLLGLSDTDRLLKRLIRHGMGEEAMEPTEVQAARIVIGKMMPDVKAVELTGKGGGPVEHKFTAFEIKAVDP